MFELFEKIKVLYFDRFNFIVKVILILLWNNCKERERKICL